MKVCVTGGAGFIGSAFVRLLRGPGGSGSGARHRVVVLDALTYAGNMENLAGFENDPDFEFVHGSINEAASVELALAGCDAVVNFAAESHVDRSLSDPGAFVHTNVDGTRVLLAHAQAAGTRFVQVSTDEVYGSLGASGRFTETSPLAPSSPYAASKAAADLLVGAYVVSYGLDAVITRCGNNYGPRQFPEKLIPLLITRALGDHELPLYGDGLNVRDWIHVDDHCRAIFRVLEAGTAGRVYNISANEERTNRFVCERVLELLDKPWSLVRSVEDRPGHDLRYALSADRLREELGWGHEVGFEEGLRRTVDWYVDNEPWWRRVQSGDYRGYYEQMYGERLRSARELEPHTGPCAGAGGEGDGSGS